MKKIFSSIIILMALIPALAFAEQRCKSSVMHLSELEGCLRPLADGTGTIAAGSLATGMDQVPTVIPTSWMARPYYYSYNPYVSVGYNVTTAVANWGLFFALTQGIR